MNIKHVQYIQAILREGSVTNAARTLYVSQPALSQSIKQLEQEIGAPVFDHYKPVPHLSFAGEMYLEAAWHIHTIEMNLKNKISEQKGEIHTTLCCGISAQRGAQLLPHVLPEYCKKYPYVQIELVEFGSQQLEKMVRNGECDIALVTTEPQYEQLEYRLLENEQLCLMASKQTYLAQHFPDGAALSLRAARNESFVVLRPGHSIRNIQDHLFATNRFHPKILLETNNFTTALNVTAYANAVMLCPQRYIDFSPDIREHVHCYPLDAQGFERHFYLCYRKELYFAEYMQDFLETIRMVLKRTSLSEGDRIHD